MLPAIETVTKRSTWRSCIIIVFIIGFTQPSLSRAKIKISDNDCYSKMNGNSIILGNSRVEIQFDRSNGTVGGILNKKTGIQFLGNGKPDIFRMEYATLELHGANSKDVWSAGYGSLTYGTKQKLSSANYIKTLTDGKLKITYDSLNLGNRKIPISVAYTVELKTGEEETGWSISIDNKDAGTIREVEISDNCGIEKNG